MAFIAAPGLRRAALHREELTAAALVEKLVGYIGDAEEGVTIAKGR